MQEQPIPVSVNGRTLDVWTRYRSRSEDLIVLIHGLGCTQDSFRKGWECPALKSASLLSLDLIGFGGSAKPPDFSYSMEAQADVVGQIIRSFPVPRLHVVAHSMGGAVALLLDPNILGSLVSLVNVEGNLVHEDCGVISDRTTSDSYDVFRKTFPSSFETDFNTDGGWYFAFDESAPIAFYKSAKSLVEWSDSGELLRKFGCLACHRAYVYGDKNDKMPVLTRLRKELPDVALLSVPDAGHFMMNENPEEFYRLIASTVL